MKILIGLLMALLAFLIYCCLVLGGETDRKNGLK